MRQRGACHLLATLQEAKGQSNAVASLAAGLSTKPVDKAVHNLFSMPVIPRVSVLLACWSKFEQRHKVHIKQ
jgi:hypothetical protein